VISVPRQRGATTSKIQQIKMMPSAIEKIVSGLMEYPSGLADVARIADIFGILPNGTIVGWVDSIAIQQICAR
jgi:hypothetical protein